MQRNVNNVALSCDTWSEFKTYEYSHPLISFLPSFLFPPFFHRFSLRAKKKKQTKKKKRKKGTNRQTLFKKRKKKCVVSRTRGEGEGEEGKTAMREGKYMEFEIHVSRVYEIRARSVGAIFLRSWWVKDDR